MKSAIIPKSLVKGDKIAIISTARKIDVSQLEYAKNIFNRWGLEIVEGQNLRAEYHQFCGTDEQRASDLQVAINDNEIKAIVCFRGGYGSVRILDSVDFSNLILNPKWICGYSDITAIHNVLAGLNIASLHATMPVNFKSSTQVSLNTFKDSLFGNLFSIETAPHKLNRLGKSSGKLVGGNLSMLYSLSGTKYDIDTAGKILFIEDLDEYLYHIDRMMWNLKLSGKLENLVGLIVGGMTNMNDNEIPFGKTAKEIILEVVKEYNYPVCFDFPVGHLDDNQTLTLNKEATLSILESKVVFGQ